ncbi:MAG: ABC transporter permease [Planctomycetota bacterium]|nr:ABC transporter permease [Planctomycetota bacterium]MDA1105066.1 ABC transporter permease [Planctomycetota bacterium]
MSDLSIVLRSLRTRLLSTTISVASVAVAVALLLVLLSLRESATQAFRRGSGNAHLMVGADASPLVVVLNGLFYANPPSRSIPHAKAQEIRTSFPWAWSVATQLGDSYRGSPLVATEPALFTAFEPVAGRPFQFRTGAAFDRPFQVVVGAQAAAMHGLRVGDKIVTTHGSWGSREGGHQHENHPCEVVGTLEPTGSAHDRALFTALETSWVIHAEERLEREEASHTGEADGDAHADDAGHDHDHGHIHVEVADLTDEDRLVTDILLRLPTRPGSDASAAMQSQYDRLRRDPTITVAQPAQEVGRLFAIVGSIDEILLAMALAVLVSSGIGILLSLYNSMEMRRRHIAILRVLGTSAGRVFGMVLAEAAIIGLLGAVGGVLLTLVAGSVAAELVEARVGLVLDSMPPVRTVIAVVAGSVVLAMLAGVLPAIRAYGTPIVRHLGAID